MKKRIFAALYCLSMLIVSNQLCFAQTSSVKTQQTQIEKIKQKVAKIGVGHEITVRRAGQEFYGSVRSIDADGFQIYELDQKHTIDFKYDQLDGVSKGYGGINHMTGKRASRHGGLIGLAIVGGIFAFIFIALATAKD